MPRLLATEVEVSIFVLEVMGDETVCTVAVFDGFNLEAI